MHKLGIELTIYAKTDLLSYLQNDLDERSEPGRFILTGSQHFGLSHSISQTLAGRCGILILLPLSIGELLAFPNAPKDLFSVLCQGAYPRIFDQNIPAHQWLADYITTYVQRDVREVVNVGDLQAFSSFLKLCAGRTAQEINLSAIGGDAGVSHKTVRSWLSVLETSYIIHRLPAWHINVRKQVVKAPKLHFIDSGLACHLLGIREPEQLYHHPLRGAIFESWVVAEIFKAHVHSGDQPRIFHYRETRGIEIDLLIDRFQGMDAIEIKSGATISRDFFKNLERFHDRLNKASSERLLSKNIVYGGDTKQKRSTVQVLPWRDVHDLMALG